jgi:hypothetical protein
VAVIDSYLKENDLPQPTFDVDSPRELPHDPNVQRARMLLIEKASALANLATGAADHLLWQQMIVRGYIIFHWEKRRLIKYLG